MRVHKSAVPAIGALLLTLMMVLPGCEVRTIDIVIPDFASASVNGVALHRVNDDTGSLEFDDRIIFVGLSTNEDGEEVLAYRIGDGSDERIRFSAVIDRDASNPDRITVRLMYSTRNDPGWYKATTYNIVGASPPSTTQTFL